MGGTLAEIHRYTQHKHTPLMKRQEEYQQEEDQKLHFLLSQIYEWSTNLLNNQYTIENRIEIIHAPYEQMIDVLRTIFHYDSIERQYNYENAAITLRHELQRCSTYFTSIRARNEDERLVYEFSMEFVRHYYHVVYMTIAQLFHCQDRTQIILTSLHRDISSLQLFCNRWNAYPRAALFITMCHSGIASNLRELYEFDPKQYGQQAISQYRILIQREPRYLYSYFAMSDIAESMDCDTQIVDIISETFRNNQNGLLASEKGLLHILRARAHIHILTTTTTHDSGLNEINIQQLEREREMAALYDIKEARRLDPSLKLVPASILASIEKFTSLASKSSFLL